MSTSQPTVQFSFGDTTLEGQVVHRDPVGAYNRPPEDMLTVEVDGEPYRVLEHEADPV